MLSLTPVYPCTCPLLRYLERAFMKVRALLILGSPVFFFARLLKSRGAFEYDDDSMDFLLAARRGIQLSAWMKATHALSQSGGVPASEDECMMWTPHVRKHQARGPKGPRVLYQHQQLLTEAIPASYERYLEQIRARHIHAFQAKVRTLELTEYS